MDGRGRTRSEQSRNAVLAATRELVEQDGYAHLTIEKIAARAHVGKPTIYRWWQSKNAILAECVLAGEVLPTPNQETSAEGIGADISEWFRAVLDYIDENAALLRGLVAATYEDAAIAEQLRSHLAVPIEAALSEWAEGSGGSTRNISPAALTQLLFGAILYRLAAIDQQNDVSRDELFDLLIAQFLRP
jgi:AcrR family transcriptional regulator